MDWTELAPFIAILGALDTMWWQLSSRIDALNKLLTDNLVAPNRNIGELKGTSHTHTRALN